MFHPNLVPNFGSDRDVENDTCQTQLQKFKFVWQVYDSINSFLILYLLDIHYNDHLVQTARKNKQQTTFSNVSGNPLWIILPTEFIREHPKYIFHNVHNTQRTTNLKITSLVDPPKKTYCRRTAAIPAQQMCTILTDFAPTLQHLSSQKIPFFIVLFQQKKTLDTLF